MNRWDRKLHEIKEHYNLHDNVRNSHIPYSLMKRYAKRYVEMLLNHYLEFYPRSEIAVICQKRNSWVDSVFHGCIIIVLEGINDISDKELKDLISDKFSNVNISSIISLCDYMRNLRVSQILYGMGDYHYIDTAYYLKYKGINVRRTDFSLGYSIKNAPYIFRDWLGYYAQKNDILKKWLNKPIWRTMLYGDGWVSFREYNITYLSWKNKLLSDDEYALRVCIGMLIDVRDFSTLFDLIGFGTYDDLKSELQDLISELKKTIDNRTEKATVFNWVDNVAYKKLEDMPWLNSIKNQWINFTNVHSSACWTEMEMKVLLSGEHPIKDKLFLKRDADSDYYRILDEIVKRGYIFKYIGENSTGRNIFPKRFLSFSNIREDDYTDSQVQWEAICYLAEKNVPLFLLVHNNWQTHSPYFSMTYTMPEHRDYMFASEMQKKAARKYSDDILHFYEGLYGNASKYYFSDHGDLALKEGDYVDLQSHIVFIAHVNKELECCEEGGLLSTAELGKLMLKLDEGSDYNDCFMDAITIDSYDIYGGRIEYVKTHNLKKELWMQCETVRSTDDMLIRYADGEQHYFLLSNIGFDLKDKNVYQNRINYLKDYFSEFIDISSYQYFNNSLDLYSYFDIDYNGWKNHY